MTDAATRWLDHPADVLGFAGDRLRAGGRVALLMVTETVGGALRAPGAVAAVTEAGAMAGYVSNGCVDADIALQAQAALATGRPRRIRYGTGSPWPDIRLPCGGSVELAVLPDPDPAILAEAGARLARREPVAVGLRDDRLMLDAAAPLAVWRPRPRLRLAGRGAALAAMARTAVAAGFEVSAASPDDGDLAALAGFGVARTEGLQVPHDVPQVADDPWTAVVLLFHDHEWEPALLRQALDGPAFFVGALGSARTHARRLERLRADGVSEPALARIVGPLGLVPSLREANLIAVSALAQVVAALEAAEAAGDRRNKGRISAAG